MSIESEIAAGLHSAEIELELDKLADQIRDEIKDISPVFGDEPPHRAEPPHGDVGSYRDSITVKGHSELGRRRVESDDYKAVWIELGAKHMPEYAPFTKVGALHGGAHPVVSVGGHDEGIDKAQKHLRGELERLAKITAEGGDLRAQRARVESARIARSAAFRANRPRRRGRSR